MPYEVPPLRFPLEALEPYVDRDALRYHHEVVHGRYVRDLNGILRCHPEHDGQTIETLLRGLDRIPGDVRQIIQHLGGGHANHQFLWKVIGPPRPREPNQALMVEIDRVFGSFEAFKSALIAQASELESEGWAFLSLSEPKTGELEIVVLPGNGSVLPIAKPGILIVDLWDHGDGSQASHAARIEAVWPVIDWQACNERFLGLRAGKSHL